MKLSLAYTQGCSGPAPALVPVYSVYSTPRVLSTMPEKTTVCCPKFSCRKKFTSDSWQLNHSNLDHPEHLQVARRKNQTICSAPGRVEPSQRRGFKANKNSVKDLDAFLYDDHVQNIEDSDSKPPPPPLAPTEIFPGASIPPSNYIAELWERQAHGCRETNLQYNPYYPFVMREKYKYIQCGINKMGMKKYYNNMPKKENTALCLPSFKNENGIQKLMASMPDDQGLGEWELHTPEDMRRNDNHKRHAKYQSRDIIQNMRWLMQHPAYNEQLIYTPQHCFNSDSPLKCLNPEMHTADWWWETLARRDTPG